MERLEQTMVVPHGNGVNLNRFAEVHLNPLRAFLEFDHVFVVGFTLAVGYLAQFTRIGSDAAFDRFSGSDILHPSGYLDRRWRGFWRWFNIRPHRQVFRGALGRMRRQLND